MTFFMLPAHLRTPMYLPYQIPTCEVLRALLPIVDCLLWGRRVVGLRGRRRRRRRYCGQCARALVPPRVPPLSLSGPSVDVCGTGPAARRKQQQIPRRHSLHAPHHETLAQLITASTYRAATLRVWIWVQRGFTPQQPPVAGPSIIVPILACQSFQVCLGVVCVRFACACARTYQGGGERECGPHHGTGSGRTNEAEFGVLKLSRKSDEQRPSHVRRPPNTIPCLAGPRLRGRSYCCHPRWVRWLARGAMRS